MRPAHDQQWCFSEVTHCKQSQSNSEIEEGKQDGQSEMKRFSLEVEVEQSISLPPEMMSA